MIEVPTDWTSLDEARLYEAGRDMTNLTGLLDFAHERESIRLRKEEGVLPQQEWTRDDILRSYRFCNIHREDDRVTRWVAQNWRMPNEGAPDLWFAMVVARFINWPPTLRAIGYPVPWRPARFLERMSKVKGKAYTGAYMVRADPESPGEAKCFYQARVVFTPMWEARERLRPKKGDSLNSYHMLLGQFHGLGSFMAAQVVADLKYSRPLRQADDWWTFAASGPGSRRGLNRVLGLSKDSPWTEDNWRLCLARLRDEFNREWTRGGADPLHAQDLQNTLCEFDKYMRVRLGEGRPRATYRTHEGLY